LITRRDFLKGSLATLVLVPIVGCSGGDSPSAPGGGNPSGCEGLSTTGSSSSGHIHTLCVPDSDLSSPPASGVTYTTSSSDGHTHTVSLNQSQLQTIAGGGSVTVTSSGPVHTHNFAVKMAP